MNAEYLQDALNYLDDELIEETDALRRGARTIRRKPKMIRWVIPAAACLGLAIGAVSIFPVAQESMKNDSVYFDAVGGGTQGAANGMPESGMTDESLIDVNWQMVTCGAVSLELPPDWDYELITGSDGSGYIRFGPAGEPALMVGYDPAFGVCGTGLEEKEITIAGMKVRAGYYDGAAMWSFAVYRENWIFINEGSKDWWREYGDTANIVLDTVIFKEEGS